MGTSPKVHYRNADFMRVVAAASVIFSHAFLIADGTDAHEPVVRLLGEGHILGIFGVYVFFILSGFFVTASVPASASVWHFLWKRFLRIYPGLFVCGLLCAIVLGTAFTTAGAVSYFQQLLPFKYAVVNGVAPDYWYAIPTVQFYAEAPSLNRVVNGSLWTICQEIFCYLLLGAMFLIGLLRQRAALLFLAAAVFATFVAYGYLGANATAVRFVFLLPAFMAGVVMAFVARSGPLDPRIALLFVLALAAVLASGTHVNEIFPILAAYPIIYLATTTSMRLPSMRRIGDVSYGTYLYGWPIEQAVRGWLGPGTPWWLVLAIALPAALLAGWLSWHLLEKRAMRLKEWGPLARRRARVMDEPFPAPVPTTPLVLPQQSGLSGS